MSTVDLRKEAYRQMCYQFHGHGTGKKNEEKRMKQIQMNKMKQVRGGVGGRESEDHTVHYTLLLPWEH